jgi:lipopolysaccharide export LptBFGC system permease protein LptF
MMSLAAAVMIGCAPSATQIAQTRSEQSWAADFRKSRQECVDNIPRACTRFENALAAQRAYNLYYYSKTIPGLSTSAFTPVTVPVAIGLPRFSGGMAGLR